MLEVVSFFLVNDSQSKFLNLLIVFTSEQLQYELANYLFF